MVGLCECVAGCGFASAAGFFIFHNDEEGFIKKMLVGFGNERE